MKKENTIIKTDPLLAMALIFTGLVVLLAVFIFSLFNFLSEKGKTNLQIDIFKAEQQKEVTKENAINGCVTRALSEYDTLFNLNSTKVGDDPNIKNWDSPVVEARASAKLLDDKDFCLRRYK